MLDRRDIVDCQYNIDNGCVEVEYGNGNKVSIICGLFESQLEATNQAMSRLHRLLDDNPKEYVNLIMSGKLRWFCDLESEAIKSSYQTILQGYLRQGYALPMAEALVREVMMYN